MKRYWRLIAVATIVILAIGTFYIKSALSAGSNPEFEFEKISGDQSLLEPVVLSGSYQVTTNGAGERVTLTAEGSEYSSEQSFFERIKGMNGPEKNRLIEKYRSFMRGKSGSLSSYYEGEDAVAYANVLNQYLSGSQSEMEFTIAVLNKKTDTTTAFTTAVPNRAMYNQVYVEDVQMIDGKLKVVTQNFIRQANNQPFHGNQETHIYTFDLGKQEIVDGETVLASENDNKNWFTHMNVVNGRDMSKHETIAFVKRQEGLKPDAKVERGKSAVPEPSKELFAYNLKTDEQWVIELPKEHRDKDLMAYEDSVLYLLGRSPKQLELVLYDMETKRVKNTVTIPRPAVNDDMPGDLQSLVRIQDGKVYVYSSEWGEPVGESSSIIIIDAASGEALYTGKVTTSEPLDHEVFLHFYNMELK